MIIFETLNFEKSWINESFPEFFDLDDLFPFPSRVDIDTSTNSYERFMSTLVLIFYHSWKLPRDMSMKNPLEIIPIECYFLIMRKFRSGI